MATYYVGSGGNDSNDGLSWANRFLTLNGAEDEPVAAGDTVYVAPGTYPEQLTCDVSGSSGSPITYIADVTGAHTDGVGGVVCITGSDDDQSATRSYGIDINSQSYRTFRGFVVRQVTNTGIYLNTPSVCILQDMRVLECPTGIYANGTQSDNIIERCVIQSSSQESIHFATSQSDTNWIIRNTVIGGAYHAIENDAVGGIVVRNCSLPNYNYKGIDNDSAPPAGQTLSVYNSVISGTSIALESTATAFFVEDYNSISNTGTARSNVNTGSNSNAYLPYFTIVDLDAGFRLFDSGFCMLGASSALRAIADDGSAPTDDLYGMMRPTYNGRRSWGAVQWPGWALDTGTKRSGSYAIKWAGGAGYYVMTVPVSASTSTTISCYVYRESGYVDTDTFLPRMIIREPGQSDRVTTDTGDAAQWNQLTDTWTPGANTTAVQVIIECDNNSGTDYAVWVDDIEVS